jgi:hypothetical protein
MSRESEDTPAPGVTSRRTFPVRLPVSLPPELHRRFKRWAVDQAEAADIAEVPMAAAVRALVRLVVDDPELTARVIADVLEER